MCMFMCDQSGPTLCDPMDSSPPGSSVQEILQARILEGLPFLPSGDVPNPGIEPATLMSPALAGCLRLALRGKPPSRTNAGPTAVHSPTGLQLSRFKQPYFN